MIAVGDRVVYRSRPDLIGTIIAVEEPGQTVFVRWDLPWGLSPLPKVRESAMFLIPVSGSQTRKEAA